MAADERVLDTYEHQRWYPFRGWCDALLPTDRPRWCSRDGQEERPQASVLVPAGCAWRSDWYVDLDGVTDEEGWWYALDMPTYYQPDFHVKKSMSDCVRRRRWVRIFAPKPVIPAVAPHPPAGPSSVFSWMPGSLSAAATSALTSAKSAARSMGGQNAVLPPGWMEMTDEQGRPYYVDTHGDSHWSLPERQDGASSAQMAGALGALGPTLVVAALASQVVGPRRAVGVASTLVGVDEQDNPAAATTLAAAENVAKLVTTPQRLATAVVLDTVTGGSERTNAIRDEPAMRAVGMVAQYVPAAAIAGAVASGAQLAASSLGPEGSEGSAGPAGMLGSGGLGAAGALAATGLLLQPAPASTRPPASQGTGFFGSTTVPRGGQDDPEPAADVYQPAHY